MATRDGWKVWRCGNRLTLAPTKTKARQNFAAEFGCAVKSGEVLPFKGPFHLTAHGTDESWEVDEQQFVATVGVYGENIVYEA